MCVCMYVCLCLYVCVQQVYLSFSVNVCCRVAKILENHLFGIEYFQLNGASPIFLLHDLNLDFQGQTFGIRFVLPISREW